MIEVTVKMNENAMILSPMLNRHFIIIETKKANYLIFAVNVFVGLCKMQNQIYPLLLKQNQAMISLTDNHFLQIYANFTAILTLKMFSEYTFYFLYI